MRVAVEALASSQEPPLRLYPDQRIAMLLEPGSIEMGWRKSELTRFAYGVEQLMCTGSRSTTKELVRGILAKLSAFMNGQPQNDDMTLVVAKADSTPTCSSTTSGRRDAS